ncbi:MAG: hypothetical protein LLG15_11885 [Betaproteobacteria bacterium]|nr:hypothetical protein [Betaproteobacteria bacterium]
MKPFAFTIHTGRGEHILDAYQPHQNSRFVVHRAIGGGDWCVTHRGSTYIAVTAETRKRGMDLARDLDLLCPLASEVAMDPENSRRLIGPVEPFREELRAAILKLTGVEA